MEDLDTARVVPGAAEDILRTLERFGLTWDGTVIFQSRRPTHYDAALEILLRKRLVYACACSRVDLARSASAPDRADAASGSVYPGTCRAGLPPGKEARALRFRVPAGSFTFEDLVLGSFSEDVAAAVGDFVVQRADGPYAYQLAVVVDDAEQGVTEVVRGADLLSSTARQIALQRALGVPTPSYAHLPVVLGPDGSKLGKRDGALPLTQEDGARIRTALALALRILGQAPADGSPGEMLQEALGRFDPRAIPREPWRISAS
jgi:glutamyl-Q tRNA(Asp) synthetase